MIFHAFASQPLVFVGTTGPLILFDDALMQFCDSMGYNFLTIRLYVGIWLSIIALTMAAFEGSVYVRLFTRFTQEIFSALITLIYIVETALKLVSTFKRHPLLAEYVYMDMTNSTNMPIEAAIDEDSNGTSIQATASALISNLTDNSNLLPPFDKNGPLNQPNTGM